MKTIMPMPSDTSQILWFCPLCGKPFKKESLAKNHITNSRQEPHFGKNGETYEIEWREPQFEEFPFEEWKQEVAEAAEEHAADGQVNVKQVEEAVDKKIPHSYIIFSLDRMDYSIEPHQAKDLASISWEDLTDTQQHAILAKVYFTELTLNELAETNYAGYAHQSSISKATTKYGWMLSHPDVDTPVQPIEYIQHEGEVQTNGVDEAVQEIDRIGAEEEREAEDVIESIDSEIEAAKEESEEVAGDEELVVDDVDLAFNAVIGLVETERYDDAKELFRQFVE